jgi:large subunit ribosomal protein L22
MVKKEYQKKIEGKKVAKAVAKNQRASLKYSTELVREIKGKRLDKAEAFIKRILKKEEYLPLRVYNKKVGHRKGDAKSFSKSGRFPKGTLNVFLKLLESVKANADYKGLDSENLMIVHAFASQGFQRTSFQSQGKIGGKRRKRKSTHIEVIVMEGKQ